MKDENDIVRYVLQPCEKFEGYGCYFEFLVHELDEFVRVREIRQIPQYDHYEEILLHEDKKTIEEAREFYGELLNEGFVLRKKSPLTKCDRQHLSQEKIDSYYED